MGETELLGAAHWFKAYAGLIIPLVLSGWMAWGDFKTRRIPNYLTFGTAIAGLGFQAGMHGLSGLISGLLGLVTGFALLILFYVKGGMGAGDVKALAALGTWLGPAGAFELFIYMAISGGILCVAVLWWRGQLLSSLTQGLRALKNFFLSYLLLRPHRSLGKQPAANPSAKTDGIPYALALAIGMAVFLARHLLSL